MARFAYAMLVFVIVSLVPAFAQCEQRVDDQANVFGSKAQQVQTAVDKLVSDTGADVHVLTVSSMGVSPTFEKYVHHVIETCPAWQGVDGGVKSNLIVVAVALKERKTAIIFGAEWKPALDSQHQRIQSSNINPRFKSGDYAGGFVAGLNEIDRVVVAFQHPTVPGQPAPAPVPSSSPDIRPASTTNVDFSGLGTFLYWCMLILSGVAALYLLYRVFVELQKNRDARNLAQQRAIRSREKIMERALSSEMAVGDVGAEVFSLRRVVSVADAARVDEFFSQAELACKEGMDSHLRLLQTSGDPGKSGLTAAQYDDICREYEKVEDVFIRMDGLLESVRAEVMKIHRAVESAEATIKASEAAIVETEKSVATAKAHGLKVPLAEKAIGEARKFFGEALEFYNLKQYSEMMTKLKVATDALNRADKILASTLQKKVDLINCLDRIGELMNSAPVAVEQARDTLVAAREKFNVLDIALANDYFEEVTKLITSAEKKWQKCKSFQGDQEWDKALALAEEAEKLLVDAVSTSKIISEFPARFAKLAAELDGKVDEAEALVKKLSDFIREHQNELPTAITGKVEQFEERLQTLTRDVRGSLTGVVESTDIVDTLIKDAKHVLSVVEAAVRKVEQGRVRAHEKNRSGRSSGGRGSGRNNDRSKGKSGKNSKSKDSDDSRSSWESGGSVIIVPVDQSMDSRDDLGRTSDRGSSYDGGSASRRSSDSGRSGGGDSDFGGVSGGFGGGDSSFGGGGDSGGGGGDSSW